MSRNVVSGGSYCENLPDGSWAAFAGDGIQTHFGFVRSFNGALPLYLRITNAGGFKMAGQGSNVAGTLLWDQGWQLDPRICNGQSACIFDLQGHLHIVEPGEGVTSQGFRYVAANGTLVMGDATYGPRHGLNEYTDLSDAQDGSLLIGQGNPGGGVRVWDGATLRELEAGNCTFIRAHRDGQAVAIAFVKAGEGSVFHWLTVAELRALPIVQPDAPPPVDPPPVDPPDNPEPKPVPIPDQTAVIAAVRAKYPTPLGAQHAAFLLEAAAAVGQGAGLLRKDTGSNIQLPDGVRVSQDVMVFPNGDGYDFLGSGETSATPQWGGPIEGSPFPASRFYAVTGAQPGPGPTPGPTPTPTGSLDAMVKSMIAAAVAPLAAKVAALEAKPSGPGGSFPSRIALKSAHGKYIAAETNGHLIANRESAGEWEQFTVEPM